MTYCRGCPMSHESDRCSQFAVSDSLHQMIETVSRLIVV